jgi:hypothetical protein
MELKQNIKEFIKKLFIRYNDDSIFRDKVAKLVNELNGYSVVVLTKADNHQFKFDTSKPLDVENVDISIRQYIDILYDDKVITNRLSSISDKDVLYKAIIAEFVYINMTGFSVGIKLNTNDLYKDLFLETIKLYRLNINKDIILKILCTHKEALLALSKYSMPSIDVEYNSMYLNVLDTLRLEKTYNSIEIVDLRGVLNNLVLKKQLPIILDNWIQYGILRVWCKLNSKRKEVEEV